MLAQDVERLVKCRVQSEVEARKLAEVKMKRAMKEALELKEALAFLRQEKKDLEKRDNQNSIHEEVSNLKKALRQKTELIRELEANSQKSDTMIEPRNDDADQHKEILKRELDHAQDLLRKEKIEKEACLRRERDLSHEIKKWKQALENSKNDYGKELNALQEEKSNILIEKQQYCEQYQKASRRAVAKDAVEQRLAEAEKRLLELKDLMTLKVQDFKEKAIEKVRDMQQQQDNLRLANTTLHQQIEELKYQNQINEDEYKKQIQKRENDIIELKVLVQDRTNDTLSLEKQILHLTEEADFAKKDGEKWKGYIYEQQNMNQEVEAKLKLMNHKLTLAQEENKTLQDERKTIETMLKRNGVSLAFLMQSAASTSAKEPETDEREETISPRSKKKATRAAPSKPRHLQGVTQNASEGRLC